MHNKNIAHLKIINPSQKKSKLNISIYPSNETFTNN